MCVLFDSTIAVELARPRSASRSFSRHRPRGRQVRLVDLELPKPVPGEHDLLVHVRAVSVNPVDTKVCGARHQGSAPAATGEPRVLGWNAAGVVVEVGAEGGGFRGRRRGVICRRARTAGVERRVPGRRRAARRAKPRLIGFAEAAALPLTSITAWELLFDRFGVREGESGSSLLVSGAAGGVGSILRQLARKLTGLAVIGTASRPETAAWRGGSARITSSTTRSHWSSRWALGRAAVRYVASLTATAAELRTTG